MPIFPPSPAVLKRGVKPKPSVLIEAGKVANRTEMSSRNEASYWAVEVSAADIKSGDRRGPSRKRTRLRSGKILDPRNKFLMECQVHDRSVYGAQLHLLKQIALPRSIRLYDDEHGALLDAKVIWQKNGRAGIRFLTQIDERTKTLGRISNYAGKYFAI